MGNHQGRELHLADDGFGQLGNQFSTGRIERCCMLVQQQNLRLSKGRHQQAERLSLPAGQQPYFGAQPVLQPDTQPV
ncbi:hypothetical protein D3C81_1997880 [compost metagenome]